MITKYVSITSISRYVFNTDLHLPTVFIIYIIIK